MSFYPNNQQSFNLILLEDYKSTIPGMRVAIVSAFSEICSSVSNLTKTAFRAALSDTKCKAFKQKVIDKLFGNVKLASKPMLISLSSKWKQNPPLAKKFERNPNSRTTQCLLCPTHCTNDHAYKTRLKQPLPPLQIDKLTEQWLMIVSIVLIHSPLLPSDDCSNLFQRCHLTLQSPVPMLPSNDCTHQFQCCWL